MLVVRTFIKESSIAGIGLFADQDIPRGAKIWIFQKDFDLVLSPSTISHLPVIAQEHLHKYAYVSKSTGLTICPTDNGRFMNHSSTPNVAVLFTDESPEDINTAARDIKKGEELTINYENFDVEFSTYKDTYR